MTRTDYRLGRNVARTYLDYYHVVGVIPLGLPASPGALKRAGRRSRPRHRRRSRYVVRGTRYAVRGTRACDSQCPYPEPAGRPTSRGRRGTWAPMA